MTPVPPETVAWVEREVGEIRRIEVMPDASHTNHRLELGSSSGATFHAVLRRYTDGEARTDDPWYVPADEVTALRTLEVTDRGVAVAILAPLPPAASVLERLVAEGRATPPHGDLLDLRRPPMKTSRRASRALQRERADRRL